jgi:hypothetical protein
VVDSLHVIFHIPVRKMLQRVAQVPDFAVHQNLFMGIGTAPGGPITAEQSNIIVRIAPAPPPLSV